MSKKVEVGRLAFRVEGEWWNAYWAPSQTSMKGAIHLGSVRMNLAVHTEVKAAFMDCMRVVFAAVVKDATGLAPSWGTPREAPERERAGRA